jgi:TolA-binding protein
MKKSDWILLSVFLVLCVVFAIQQSMLSNLNDKVDVVENTSIVTDDSFKALYAEQADQIAKLQKDVERLQTENSIQAIALDTQAHMLEDYDQHVEDLDHELKAYEYALEEVKPKIQLPTTWTGSILTKEIGGNMGPAGRETYYNLPMQGCINKMRELGYSEEEYPYWVRDDGAKMLGRYVMIAANWKIRPLGTVIETSLGWSIVVDTGEFVADYPY